MKMAISYLEGWRFSSKCRNHEIISDQPTEEDGQDTGMTPVEMFISSIGCCMGVYAKMFCDRHKIPMEGMNIVLEWNTVKKPSRVGELQVKILFKKILTLSCNKVSLEWLNIVQCIIQLIIHP